jgi:hypothetical protein
MYDLDEIIRFSGSVATASAINFRPDIWILPFLNVYGLFSKAKTSTDKGRIWISWKQAAIYRRIAIPVRPMIG